jgi:hypothetical protein
LLFHIFKMEAFAGIGGALVVPRGEASLPPTDKPRGKAGWRPANKIKAKGAFSAIAGVH